MSTGAHVRPEPHEALLRDRRRSSEPVPRRRATDREHEREAMCIAYDREVELREIDLNRALLIVERICRNFMEALDERAGMP
jgi:hypothetical protein